MTSDDVMRIIAALLITVVIPVCLVWAVQIYVVHFQRQNRERQINEILSNIAEQFNAFAKALGEALTPAIENVTQSFKQFAAAFNKEEQSEQEQ